MNVMCIQGITEHLRNTRAQKWNMEEVEVENKCGVTFGEFQEGGEVGGQGFDMVDELNIREAVVGDNVNDNGDRV